MRGLCSWNRQSLDTQAPSPVSFRVVSQARKKQEE